MVDHAASVGTDRDIIWRQADVIDLPFDDGSFDVVVSQFGVMFFPDRPKAFAEIGRVLRPGGVFIFNTWDRIETNEFADVVTSAAASVFPDDPPHFLARTPHGYYDHDEIRRELSAGDFEDGVEIDVLEARSRAASAEAPAIAYCHGTPLRNEIESRDESSLAHVTAVATARIADRFGDTDVDGLIRGFVVTARPVEHGVDSRD
jgi:SAM-dependent methyltransferase